MLVHEDPTLRLQSFAPGVQQSIRDGYVERGMTREQVLMAVGYPPTHETASLDQDQNTGTRAFGPISWASVRTAA